jgi:hypothetical protein
MARLLDFSDGFTSASAPTQGTVTATALAVYANDAAYVAAKGSAAANGDSYYNSTTNLERIYANGAWKNIVDESTAQNLSNKTLVDNADATKKLAVDLSGATTATKTTLASSQSADRTITLPNATTTLVGRDTTDTLTNKTVAFGSNTFSGQLPVANGGTGAATKAAGFDALSPMTTSGDIIYGGSSGTGTRLAKGSDGQVLTLAAGVPTWATGGATAPTLQKFTSGSGTYTRPSSPTPLYIRVRIVGGGGGGGGGGGNGGAGGNTTFGSSLLTANGGTGGYGGTNNNNRGGEGGTASIASPAVGIAVDGSGGGSGIQPNGIANAISGAGGSSAFGGGGAAYAGVAHDGLAGATNSGSGGSGGVSSAAAVGCGGGGGSGGFVDAIITSPSSTYSYAVGAAGTAGTSGGVAAGGVGGAGQIIVEEFYQ